jgi:SAM-dependent methyltransferase
LELSRTEQYFPASLESVYAHIEKLAAHFAYRLARECNLASCVPEAFYLREFVADILAEEGCAEEGRAEERRAPHNLPSDESALLYEAAFAAHPEADPIFRLMQRCHAGAPDFISGKRSGVSIVFPRGDMSLWERVHREDAVMSVYSTILPAALRALLKPGARVLEVGAGTGAVLRKCLPVLKEREAREYWFTDLGHLFVQRAEQDFSGEEMARYVVINLDQGLAPQGLEPGSFDVIAGVNVLHAVRDLGFSLRELRALLRDNGALILGEGSPPRRGRRWRLDFVFAFLRGWWDVTLDPEFRPRPGFLFPDEWTRLLTHCGYSSAQAFPGEAAFAGDCRGGLLVASK